MWSEAESRTAGRSVAEFERTWLKFPAAPRVHRIHTVLIYLPVILRKLNGSNRFVLSSLPWLVGCVAVCCYLTATPAEVKNSGRLRFTGMR